MRSRHAAALALVGWYLMTPPLRSPQSVHWNEGKPQQDTLTPAPLSQWRTVNSFDSASECREAKQKLFKDRFRKLYEDKVLNTPKGYTGKATQLRNQCDSGQQSSCIDYQEFFGELYGGH